MKYNLKSFWRQDFLLGYLSFMALIYSIRFTGIKIEIPHINKLLLPG